jgi:hypothetical protein
MNMSFPDAQAIPIERLLVKDQELATGMSNEVTKNEQSTYSESEEKSSCIVAWYTKSNKSLESHGREQE